MQPSPPTKKPADDRPQQSQRVGEALAALAPEHREQAIRIAAALMARKAGRKDEDTKE